MKVKNCNCLFVSKKILPDHPDYKYWQLTDTLCLLTSTKEFDELAALVASVCGVQYALLEVQDPFRVVGIRDDYIDVYGMAMYDSLSNSIKSVRHPNEIE